MNQLKNQSPRTPFLDNLYIVNHKRSHKFLSVAKVGSTMLKYITAIDDRLDMNDARTQGVHTLFGTKANRNTMVKTSSSLYADYFRVVPFRDPVERVTSWYKDKILGLGSDTYYNNYYLKLDLINEADYKRILEFIEFEITKPHGNWIEEHLRPISRYISSVDFDLIVPIEYLDVYLRQIGCKPEQVPQQARNSTQRADFSFPNSVQKKLKRLYAADYKMANKANMWKPTKG